MNKGVHAPTPHLKMGPEVSGVATTVSYTHLTLPTTPYV